MDLLIKCVRPGAVAPRYARTGDAGLDFCAAIERPIIVWPYQRVIIPLGWCVAVPAGHVGLLKARSGHASKGWILTGGVIDSSYRGEPRAVLVNHSIWPRRIRPGERIVQMLIMPVVSANVVMADELDSTERGAGGFGSTGS